MIVPDGSVVSRHRHARGWSQAELAERSAVSRAEISGIETGRLVPSVAVALRLASALGTQVETLFGPPSGAAPPSTPPWAWEPASGTGPVWRATMNGRLQVFPVEPTAAGAIAHDAVATPVGLDALDPGVAPDRTLVIAGCDPLVGLLVRPMAEQHGVRVVPLLRSSAEALELLGRGLVHAAGIHLSDAGGRPQNDRAVSSRLGPGYCLLRQLRWESGVALAPVRRERSVAAVLRANLRWVNREEGSAARQALDRLLGADRRPNGYRHVVRDHRAVAATVSSGWAEAGICIRPVAADARLDFIRLQDEAYDLCLPEALMDDPRITALVGTVRSARYRASIAGVPGCSPSGTGELHVVA